MALASGEVGMPQTLDHRETDAKVIYLTTTRKSLGLNLAKEKKMWRKARIKWLSLPC